MFLISFSASISCSLLGVGYLVGYHFDLSICTGEFIVGGSALGEQCFFAALGLGLRCVGYELMYNSLIVHARSLAADLNLNKDQVEFLSEDMVNLYRY